MEQPGIHSISQTPVTRFPLDTRYSDYVRTKAWVWRYRVRERATGRLVADGETTQVMYDYAAGASTPLLQRIRDRLVPAARVATA